MESHHILLEYSEFFRESFYEFEDSLNADDFVVHSEAKPVRGFRDSAIFLPQILIPTAVIVFIAKSYFDSFLKEMGKDHYHLLKKKLASLSKNIIGKKDEKKLDLGDNYFLARWSSSCPYSQALSICAEVNDACKFKLLLPKKGSKDDYSLIINRFLDFLYEFHSGAKTLKSIGFNEEVARHDTIVVHMNPKTNNIEWLEEWKFEEHT